MRRNGYSNRSESTAIGGPVFQIARLVSRALLTVLTRPRLVGAANVPRQGSLLVVSNHASMIDTIVLAALFPRPIAYLGKRELFRWAFFAWGFRAAGVIPINRQGVDRRALELGLDVLKREGSLVVFAEGTRSGSGILGPAKAGVGLLAARSRAAVLPVAITGTEGLDDRRRWFLRPVIELRCGEVIEPVAAVPPDGYQGLADRYLQAVAELLPGWRRGPRYDSQRVDQETMTPPAGAASSR
jgi:1-acyl-sn-glycerol-3-phosphate acyltransferase